MTSTFESGDKIQQDLGMAPTAPDNSHTVHPKRALADAPLEHQSSASSGSSTLSQETRTPEDTPEDSSISQTTTGIKSTDPDNQSDDEDEDEDGDEDEDSASTDEDSDEDFPRFEDAPRGRIVKPVSGPKPTKPPK
ncbi:hypothetical protein BJ912DRAFT_1061375 [Pholiota molesta]|nr:hypothetical protein BJ912DRAFT_1061375 [Pholiota molesta]